MATASAIASSRTLPSHSRAISPHVSPSSRCSRTIQTNMRVPLNVGCPPQTFGSDTICRPNSTRWCRSGVLAFIPMRRTMRHPCKRWQAVEWRLEVRLALRARLRCTRPRRISERRAPPHFPVANGSGSWGPRPPTVDAHWDHKPQPERRAPARPAQRMGGHHADPAIGAPVHGRGKEPPTGQPALIPAAVRLWLQRKPRWVNSCPSVVSTA